MRRRCGRRVRAGAALPLASTSWARLADCDAVLARVALEPDWREGEPERVTLLSQTVLAQSRALLVAIEAFHDESMADALAGALADRTSSFQSNVADALEHYAAQLAAQPPEARTPASLDAAGWLAARAGEEGAARAAALAREARRVDAALSGLPRWTSGPEESGAPAAAG